MTRRWASSLAALLGAAGVFLSAEVSRAQDRWPDSVAPSVIGDSGRDLVFTPVAPCRVIDTRFAVGGKLIAGVPRDFDIAGTLSEQGGAPDCLIPFGPATAVAINLVAVAPSGPGNLRAWAFGGTVPNAAVLNYGVVSGLGALANGVIIPLCNPATSTCTRDVTIRADVSDVQLVADVAGYFSGVTGLTVPWTEVTSKPAGFADVDNDTTYTAGTGLSLSGTLFNVNTSAIQNRVTGTCPAGSSIRAIDQAGTTPTCETDNDTTYSAAPTGGLTLSGTQFSIAAAGVTSAMLLDGTIGNADVAASAGIAASKVGGTAAVLSFTGTQAFDTSTLVIDSSSNGVGFGTTTPLSPLSVATSTEPLAASAQIGHGSAVRGLVVKRTANDTGYTNLTLLKSRGDALTPAQTGDGVGQLLFDAVDPSSVIRRAGEVRVDVVTLSSTDLETTMSFEVHDSAPSSASVERLRVTSTGIAVTGAAAATGNVTAGGTVTAGGDVIAGGGVFVARMPPPGAATSSGILTGVTWDTGCTASNRGEIRVIESPLNVDRLCVCLSLAAGDLQWTCFSP